MANFYIYRRSGISRSRARVIARTTTRIRFRLYCFLSCSVGVCVCAIRDCLKHSSLVVYSIAFPDNQTQILRASVTANTRSRSSCSATLTKCVRSSIICDRHTHTQTQTASERGATNRQSWFWILGNCDVVVSSRKLVSIGLPLLDARNQQKQLTKSYQVCMRDQIILYID